MLNVAKCYVMLKKYSKCYIVVICYLVLLHIA